MFTFGFTVVVLLLVAKLRRAVVKQRTFPWVTPKQARHPLR